MLVCFSFHGQVVVNVHITYLGASENTDQIGKNTLDIHKDENCTKQKNTSFQFCLTFRPVLFCFPVILNAEKLL